MRRVAITGIGVVSALGTGREAFWRALAEGRSGVGPISAVRAPDLKITQTAEVRDFDALAFFDAKAAGQLDRNVLFAGAAAAEAVADSGVTFAPHRAAVVMGCSVGGKVTEDENYRQLYAEGRTRLDPITIVQIMANASTSWISTRYSITGPAYTISTACSSATHAIGQAFWMVRSGQVVAALAGGAEAPLTLGMLRAWEALRIVAPDTCRPFSLNRRGIILGEGAAILVLEDLEQASARGAHIYAELAGFGMSADAAHVTMPSVEGPAWAMLQALEDAQLAPEEIGYINAHGTGTPANDRTEAQAIARVFAVPPAVSSTKSMHGHALGAGGAIEAAATALALSRGILPPTANFTAPDPACDLDVIPNAARTCQVEAALSNSFAFGGLNATLAFKRLG
jgi:nodulation protein E